MPWYRYKCSNCGTCIDISHSIPQCAEDRVCGTCDHVPLHRLVSPIRMVGERVKPGSKEVNAQREHECQRNIDKKRKRGRR